MHYRLTHSFTIPARGLRGVIPCQPKHKQSERAYLKGHGRARTAPHCPIRLGVLPKARRPVCVRLCVHGMRAPCVLCVGVGDVD
jgi:hypothetical protein